MVSARLFEFAADVQLRNMQRSYYMYTLICTSYLYNVCIKTHTDDVPYPHSAIYTYPTPHRTARNNFVIKLMMMLGARARGRLHVQRVDGGVAQ